MHELMLPSCPPARLPRRLVPPQEAMAFCSDREDAVSQALTAAAALMDKYGVGPWEIGHLQVGAGATACVYIRFFESTKHAKP